MLGAQWYVWSFLTHSGQQVGMLPSEPQLHTRAIHFLIRFQWFHIWFWKEICITTEAMIPTNEK